MRDVSWEIKRIEDFATEIYIGSEVTRNQLGTGDFPAVKCGDINSSLPLQFEECISFVDLNLLKKPRFFEKGDVLLSNMGGEDSVGTPTVYLGEKKCLAGDHVAVIRGCQNSKFLAYALSTNFSKNQIKNLSQKSTVYDLYVSKIKQIQIPLPPLEDQERIVEILDKFYDLSENPDKGLNNLIKLNRKQYEYYRNLIFDHLKI